MKIAYKGITGIYIVDTSTGLISNPPDKCQMCKHTIKLMQGCNLEECENKNKHFTLVTK